MWVKDFKRTIDYLETRPDTFDGSMASYSRTVAAPSTIGSSTCGESPNSITRIRTMMVYPMRVSCLLCACQSRMRS